MAYTVILGRNDSEINRAVKTVTQIATVSGVLIKEDTSVINPVLIIQTTQDITGVNYLFGENLFNGRMYFVTDIISKGHNRYELHCHVDVLTTYYNQIKSCKCIASRSNNLYNLYLEDNQIQFLSFKEIGQINKDQVGANDSTFILITAGNAST